MQQVRFSTVYMGCMLVCVSPQVCISPGVCVCVPTKQTTGPLLVDLAVAPTPSHLNTCVLFILLLGKYCVYSKVRSGSQMMSSQSFLPRSSRMGREQKSNSHTSALGTVDGPASDVAVACTASALLDRVCTPRRRRLCWHATPQLVYLEWLRWVRTLNGLAVAGEMQTTLCETTGASSNEQHRYCAMLSTTVLGAVVYVLMYSAAAVYVIAVLLLLSCQEI